MPAIKVKATKTLQTLGRVIKRELMVRDMSKNTNVKLTLSEEEFRLLSDLVETAGNYVDSELFKGTINSSPEVRETLGDKLREAGEQSQIEDIYGEGLWWYQQGFRSKCQSLDMIMSRHERLDAKNSDHDADQRDLMFNLLAVEQAKKAYFIGFREAYKEHIDIADYIKWHQDIDPDMPRRWIGVWLHRYLDEYKNSGISNLNFKLWTRIKMLFWLPPKT